MRRVVFCVVLLVVGGLSAPAHPQAPDPRPAGASALERLTVPAALLPATCRPRAPGGMFGANPSIVTDPRVLGLMHGLVFGVTPGDARAGARGAQPQAKRAGDDLLAARAADVVAGYAAAYEEEGGSPEIGVFALLMKTPPSPQSLRANAAGARVIKGSVAIFSWSDATPQAPDRGCLAVIRRHIESTEFK